ncbi:Ku protein [Massilia sp. TS11]|nr:Ku protein [Massilia sp. TS11]MCG2584474.1 Ku protein [Massilia sp. TS11]
MPRSIWKGAISFGLVHIPVEMYPATRDNALDLDLVDRRDFAPIGFKRYNKSTGDDVDKEDIVKAYQVAHGDYVLLSDEELRSANPAATQTIDILAFVDAAEVSMLYFDTPYYLAPDKGGAKVYALLRETLRRAGKLGVAKVVIRIKQHLAALVCEGDAIVLMTMRYADEIREAGELKIPAEATAISDKEVAMALSLVDSMNAPWQPEAYRDTYREDVLALVEKKVAAQQTHAVLTPEAAPTPETGNVVDLVALLKQSLGERTDTKPKPPPRKRKA